MFDPFDQGLRDGVGVVPHVVFQVGSVFVNVVGPDGASILKMNDSRPAGSGGGQRYEQGDDTKPHKSAF